MLRDHLRVPEAALAARGFPTALPPAVSGLQLLAFNNCCDVIVATAVTGDEPVAQEQAVLEFVNCDLAAQGSSDIRALVQPPPVNGPGVGAEHKEPKPYHPSSAPRLSRASTSDTAVLKTGSSARVRECQ